MEWWRSRVIGVAGAAIVGVAASACLSARSTRRDAARGRRALQAELVLDAGCQCHREREADKISHFAQTVVVPAVVEDALLRQWRIVYGSSCPEEADLERGGVVLADGTTDPGTFSFDPEPDPPLSPISSLGGARVGRETQVHAGWDHSGVVGTEPSTHHLAATVYGHFHIHPDLAKDPSTAASRQHAGSVPSLGDLHAWLVYHRNRPKAFVVTLDAVWLLWKWPVRGQLKGGVQCPDGELVEVLRAFGGEHSREPVTAGVAAAHLEGLARLGFVIYRKWIGSRTPGGLGAYDRWEGYR